MVEKNTKRCKKPQSDLSPNARQQETLQAMLNDTVEGLFSFDADGLLQFINLPFVTLSGYEDTTDCLAENPDGIIDFFAFKKDFHELIAQLLADRIVVNHEVLWRDKAGEIFWVMLNCKAQREKTDGPPSGITGSVRRTQINLFRDKRIDWTWKTDSNGTITHLENVKKLLSAKETERYIRGSSRDLSREFTVFNHQQNEFRSLIEQKRRFHDIELSWTSIHGELLSLNADGHPVFSRNGSFLGYHIAATDMTGNQTISVPPDESETRYKRLYEMSPDGIVVHQDGIIVDANYKFVEQLGYSDPSDVINLSIYDMVSPQSRDAIVQRSQKIQSDINYHPLLESTVITKNGQKINFEVSSRQVIHNGKPAVQSLGRVVSKRRQIESQLRLSEDRFRNFTNISSDWYWETDSRFRYIYVSPQYEEITQIPPQKYMGKEPLEFYDLCLSDNGPKERKRWQKLFQDMKAHRPYRDFRYTTVLPDGSSKIFSTSGNPYYDQNDDFAGYRNIGNDITDIVETATNLKQTKELLFAAIDNIPVATALFDPEGKLVLCNQKFLVGWQDIAVKIEPGTTLEEMLILLRERGLLPQQEEIDIERYIRRRLDQHNNPKMPYIVQKSDGGWHDIQEYKLDDGSTIYFAFDVSNQVAIEQKLSDSQQELSEAQRIGKVGSFKFSYLDQSVTLSDESARLLGISDNRNLSLDDMWRWVPRGEKRRILVDLENPRSATEFFYEFSHRPPGRNTCHYRMMGEKIYDDNGKAIGTRGTIQNVTELHEDAVKLRAAKEQAELANQAKTHFLAAASHDLRQPLHALGLFAENLAEKMTLAEDRQLIKNIRQTVVTLDDMFGSIMNITRLDSNALKPELEIFKLHIMLERLSLEYSEIASRRNITFKILPTKAAIFSDPAILGRILRNLISNAFKYTKEGRLLVGIKRKNGQHFLCVYDTGVGIPADNRPHIFDDFFSANPDNTEMGNSLGLGLAIVKRSAELLGSTIIVESQENKGSMFGVSLAICDIPPEMTENGPIRMIRESLSDFNIGVLDDDPSVIDATTALLKSWKCGVVNGLQLGSFIDNFKRDNFHMNVLIADYDLKSDINGIDVARTIKDMTGQDFFTIIISGTSSPEINQTASENGYFFLRKPVKPAKLRALLTHLKSKK